MAMEYGSPVSPYGTSELPRYHPNWAFWPFKCSRLSAILVFMERRRSPQDKKILSYLRDRRNSYGEHDKGSRKTIPARKALVNRTYRHAVRQVTRTEADDIDQLTSDVASVRRNPWKKVPDRPLGEHLNNRWRVRQERGGNEPSTSELRLEAFRRSKGDSAHW
jgi:hypothetical protein